MSETLQSRLSNMADQIGGENLRTAAAYIDELEARVAELEAITARMPKSADGVVWDWETPLWIVYLDCEGDWDVMQHMPAVANGVFKGHYSTEAAARKAMEDLS